MEDEPHIREIVSISLEMLGQFQVSACDSCAAALSVVDEFSPQLLLLDVMMPDVDGPATLRALRERVSAESAPAIFITARVEAGDMQRYRKIGVVDVIIKPFDTMLLPSQLEQIWQRHRTSLNDGGG